LERSAPETGSNGSDGYFTGKELDSETNLQYFGARYYMAALGRWGSVDPLADRYAGYSPYNYVLGNPNSLIDPDGRAPVAACAVAPTLCVAGAMLLAQAGEAVLTGIVSFAARQYFSPEERNTNFREASVDAIWALIPVPGSAGLGRKVGTAVVEELGAGVTNELVSGGTVGDYVSDGASGDLFVSGLRLPGRAGVREAGIRLNRRVTGASTASIRRRNLVELRSGETASMLEALGDGTFDVWSIGREAERDPRDSFQTPLAPPELLPPGDNDGR
jgi:RHS repeat-associated protein